MKLFLFVAHPSALPATMFEVQVVSRETIKPSSPTPQHLRTHKLCMIDQFAPSNHIPIILFYSNAAGTTSPPESKSLRLKDSLSRTLARFYPFAGRLNGNSVVECSDEGVDFIEARVNNGHLCQLLQHPDHELLERLLPCHASCIEESIHGILLSVQVTTFCCNGTAVGACISHKIADGTSASTFVKAWAAEARGDTEFCHPVLDAASLFPPVDNIPFTFMPSTTEKVLSRTFVFDALKIASLRSGGFRPSRIEAITALLWRCIVKARARLESRGAAVLVGHAVELRRRMAPPLPKHAFGNLWTVAVVPTVGEGSLEQQMRGALRTVDGDYVRRLQGPEGLTLMEKAFREPMAVNGDDLYTFSSWCGFRMYEEADFGWGRPRWVGVVAGRHAKNACYFMDGRREGDVEVWLTMVEEEMLELEKDEELCSFASHGGFVA